MNLVEMKRVLLFLLVVSMLFLVGCSYILGLRAKYQGPDQTPVPRGIGIGIIDNFPSLGIIEGTKYPVVLEVTNYNPKDVDVDITLSDSVGEEKGGAGSDIGITKSLIGSGLEERPAGFDKETITFAGIEYSNIEEGDTTTFRADASFDYDYRSSGKLCINGFNARPKGCPSDEILLSGAALGLDAMRSAVAVINVKGSSYASENEVTIPLEITISNVGNGFLEDDMVENIDVDISGFNVECDKRELKLTEDIKSRTISCIGAGNVEGGFVTPPLTISYKYTYVTTAFSRSVDLIKRK